MQPLAIQADLLSAVELKTPEVSMKQKPLPLGICFCARRTGNCQNGDRRRGVRVACSPKVDPLAYESLLITFCADAAPSAMSSRA